MIERNNKEKWNPGFLFIGWNNEMHEKWYKKRVAKGRHKWKIEEMPKVANLMKGNDEGEAQG